MKLELPLALGLLAFGCWLFVPSPNIGFFSAKPDSHAQNAGELASSEERAMIEELPDHSPRGVADPPSSPPLKSSLPSEESRQIVLAAADHLANGPSVQAKSRLKVNLFNQSIAAEGQYFQAGQGRGKTRFDFHMTVGASSVRLSQVCDGRFFFLESERDGETELNVADLERIGKSASAKIPFAGNPSSWLGIGGIVGLLEQLERCFDFQPPEQVTLGGIPMRRIRGTWKPAQLQQVLQYYVDSKWISPVPDWDKIPPQVPGLVELHFGNDEFLPSFPYRVAFFRTEIRDDQPVLAPIVVLEMYEVSKVEQIEDQVFFVETEGRNPKDITFRWVSRLDQFQKLAEAQPAEASPKQRK